MIRAALAVLALPFVGCSAVPDRQQVTDGLAPSLTFYASFEDGMDAAYARGDRRIYSALSYDPAAAREPWYGGQGATLAQDAGVSGQALDFTGGLSQAIFYAGESNTPWAEGGALSVWLRPGEFSGAPLALIGSDPLAPAAAIDLSSEPSQVVVRAIQGEGVAAPPSGDWLHVVISISKNVSVNQVAFYLNGEESASFDLADPDQSWDSARTTIRLGVNYVGLIDELAAFDRALTPDEVRLLHETANLPASLVR